MRLPLVSLFHLRRLGAKLRSWPWKRAAVLLRQRFREDRLGLTAGSLTFTTTIALVPLITVALAVFSAFPMFAKLQLVLQKWLVDSLVPDSIARQVLGYLTQFASQASRLGVAGVAVLFATALALVLTIDRTLNAIWRVRQPRPLAQRVLVYWAAMTLGPLLLGASVTMTSYAVSASRGLVGAGPGGVGLLLDTMQFAMVAAGVAALYRYVPNTRVQWSHAWAGGLFSAAALELAKLLLVLYLGKVPTYSLVYGTFATVPILLVWIYLAWLIVLLGAMLTATLPGLGAHLLARGHEPGWRFHLGLEALQALAQAAEKPEKGLTLQALVTALGTVESAVEATLTTLVALDWVARLDEADAGHAPRYVLLVDPAATGIAPLLHVLLLRRDARTDRLWDQARWEKLRLSELL